jgi:hypothetical protein
LTEQDLSVALAIARQLGFAIQRERLDAEIAEELAATRSLQALSVQIAHEADLTGCYEKLVDAARVIMHSDFREHAGIPSAPRAAWRTSPAGVSRFTPRRGETVGMVHAQLCVHLRSRLPTLKRVMISDVEQSDFLRGTTTSQATARRYPRGAVDAAAVR